MSSSSLNISMVCLVCIWKNHLKVKNNGAQWFHSWPFPLTLLQCPRNTDTLLQAHWQLTFQLLSSATLWLTLQTLSGFRSALLQNNRKHFLSSSYFHYSYAKRRLLVFMPQLILSSTSGAWTDTPAHTLIKTHLKYNLLHNIRST